MYSATEMLGFIHDILGDKLQKDSLHGMTVRRELL